MSAHMLQEPCTDFLEKLASAAPTPGGGGASALAGAVASALVAMVGNLTVGKKKYAAVEAQIIPMIKKADSLRLRLEHLVDADAHAFATFMQAYKLPHTTEVETAARKAAIAAAARDAAAVPLQIADICFEILKLAQEIAALGNTSLITDAVVAALLARAAVRSAGYNVKINLPLLADKQFKAQVAAHLEQLQEQSLALEEEVIAVTDNIIGK